MPTKRQFCTFRLGERLFGVDILNVKEINPETEFTPIFHAPQEVKGYVNIRGQIYLVLDLRLLLEFESREPDESSRLVLFKPEVGGHFGILVDRIGDVVDVDEAQIETRGKEKSGHPQNRGQSGPELWDGVCKLEDELLIVLKSRNLLKKLKIKNC